MGKPLQTGRYFCTTYHHEDDGVYERVFATFQAMLRTFISKLHWDKFLDACVFASYTSVHSSKPTKPHISSCLGATPSSTSILMIEHSNSYHIPSDEDPSLYEECLISAYSARQTAVSFNRKQQPLIKSQHDKSYLLR